MSTTEPTGVGALAGSASSGWSTRAQYRQQDQALIAQEKLGAFESENKRRANQGLPAMTQAQFDKQCNKSFASTVGEKLFGRKGSAS